MDESHTFASTAWWRPGPPWLWPAALVLVVGGCGASQPSSAPSQPAPPLPALIHRTHVASLDVEDVGEGRYHQRLFAGFANCGSVPLAEFEGMYVREAGDAEEPVDEPWLAATQLEGNRLRFGYSPRQDVCPTRVIARDDDEVLVLAVYHSDVDDPGDASLTYLYLRRDGARLVWAMGTDDASLWGYREHAMVRLDARLPGLDYRPRDADFGWPSAYSTISRCPQSYGIGEPRSYALDDSTLSPSNGSLTQHVWRAALRESYSVLTIGQGGLGHPELGPKLCFATAPQREGDAWVAQTVESPYHGTSTTHWVQIRSDGHRVFLRFASRREDLGEALEVGFAQLADYRPLFPDPCAEIALDGLYSLGEDDVLAVVECHGELGATLLLTRDGGASWEPLPSWEGGVPMSAVGVDGVWFISGEDAIYRTRDGGRRFERFLPHSMPTHYARGDTWLTQGPHTNPAILSFEAPASLMIRRHEGWFVVRGRSALFGRGVPRVEPVEGGRVLLSDATNRVVASPLLASAAAFASSDSSVLLEDVVTLLPLDGAEVLQSERCELRILRQGTTGWQTLRPAERPAAPAFLVRAPDSSSHFVGACGRVAYRGDADGNVRVLHETDDVMFGLAAIPVGDSVWISVSRPTAARLALRFGPDGSVEPIRVPMPSDWPPRVQHLDLPVPEL